jgi:uroporphyrinogen-III synthase
MRVLITRPQPDASRTAERLRALGHEAVVSPVLHVDPLPLDHPPHGPFTALAATSANSVRIAAHIPALARWRTLPLYAVGEHTADAARDAGFAEAIAAGGDAAALAARLQKTVAAGSRVLHLAGEARAQELGALLTRAGIAVEVAVLYRTRPAEAFETTALEALRSGRLHAALHYSPRSAEAFARLLRAHGLIDEARRVRHYCLSPAVAAPLADIASAPPVAARPNEADLLALLES